MASAVRLNDNTESETSSTNTEHFPRNKIGKPSVILKKNTLNCKNEEFKENPYLPDYSLEVEIEEKVFINESGLEVEYIEDRRK